MQIRHSILYILTALLMLSCSDDDEPASEDIIVVEGWIDSGDFPIVMLTRSLPIDDEYRPIDEVSHLMERWAKVTISDGEREEVMIGRYDKEFFPPYIYTTSHMRGEAGKTYRLHVSCTDGAEASAVATIPQPAVIDSLRAERIPDNDTLRQVYAYIADDRSEERYYKVFTHIINHDKWFLSAYLGVTSNTMMDERGRIAVNNGRINLVKEFTPYFTVGDTLVVKVARTDREAYNFWRSFEDITSLSRNPLFPITNNLPSNVSGALGFWFGYGTDTRIIVIE
ncbi:MAG: DUF4249 domain-containing protein [Prevotella sp.]